MAARAVDFPLFSRLPAELRVQIWEETLPKFVRPLYFYRAGCWTLENVGKKGVDVRFNHRLLSIDFEVPILSVNREAFRVTLSSMKSQGINAHVTVKKSIGIFWEPVNVILSERGFENIAISCTEPAPMCLAVSRLIGETEDSFLSELFQHTFHRNTQKLVLVNNAGVLSNKRRASQQHWELNSALSTPRFVWNNAGDHFEGAEGISDSERKLLRGLNRGAADGMTDGLGWDKDHKLEVHLATAIKMKL
ncbi:hypothetical protein AAWM_08549 [Aspergillus awamori]|uniref:2EXR domain-containing protein n=1 Tax=Aspergillus awamori TaxID=105351 RepID=A0A401L2B3_ASPAW|nr:hypothetical protein AAWM_08549 [Aspergillus awamori]